MIEILLSTMLVTIIPQREQYYCRLQRMERGLCIYWCANKYKGFNWFEVETENGCKIKKKYYTI